LPNFTKPSLLAQTQCLHKQSRKCVQVLLAKGSDGVVIGMLVGRQEAECDVVVGGLLDRT
jgi:hypothetical protein